ncbi:2-methylisocitrate lyase-like PEP mutase family enzyme [Aeromicrobium panaciterrae]|uniref:2-methylisocitrate lyase-like PEP mutase family enzyme n=1 Tax=Aeromicrobium panaciterrae TaxID=363861 RepID=A0ABU1UJN0_9ACTN|nr:isocitrate lyase/phosphoenolpyruvate mutase family protein [Aeromicrobium panaciterrae]MDR7085386.1 2-methylisocitrate lyase-like PEP mutase family enzyme [Aeromicrobium panaciterrae]
MNAAAAAFLALHRPGAGFILPNAWDGGSARLLEQVGFPAIATTSAGIAFSRGLPDAGMTGADMLDCIALIVEAVDCPVSADLESGYGNTPDQVASTVAAAVAIGVVGGNLEDATPSGGLFSVEEGRERLEAARSAAPAGSFVLNARTDTYMVSHPDAFAETIRRAEQYVDAGADCIFVPGVSDADEIGRLTAEIGAPVNVVAGLVEPVLDAATLRDLGVARISIGGTLTRAALSLVDRAGREMLEHGTFGFADGLISYGEFQQKLGSD